MKFIIFCEMKLTKRQKVILSKALGVLESSLTIIDDGRKNNNIPNVLDEILTLKKLLK